jgi:hypothetical protein
MLDTLSAPRSLAAGSAANASDWVEQTVRVGLRETVEMDLAHAAVEVRSHLESALRLQTRLSGWVEGGFDLERTEKGLRLSDRVTWGVLGSLFGRVQVQVRVPVEHGVDLRSGSGSVSVSGIRGPVALRTSEGELAIEDVEGPVYAVTSSGAISARGVRGELRAYTSDGTIEVEDSEGGLDVRTSEGWVGLTRVAGPVAARSSSGSMYIQFSARPSGTAATSSGTIEVSVPADARFELRAQAQGGSIELDPVLGRNASGDARSARALVNGGGECLWLRTTGGNIYVRAESPTPASPALCHDRGRT